MFEKLQVFATPDGRADVREMVGSAIEVGRPAADRRSVWVIADELKKELAEAFAAGRDWVEYDWRFLNGRACGVMCFHADGQLYGAYHFV